MFLPLSDLITITKEIFVNFIASQWLKNKKNRRLENMKNNLKVQ